MRPEPTRCCPLASCSRWLPAAPAAAFDWKTNVIDFEFQPAEQKIALGDSVTWNFVRSRATRPRACGGQPDSWKSVDDGANAAGTSYTHVFNTPGRYQYVCLQHKDFMKGVIEVGTDTVIDSVDRFRSKRTGNRVKISFLLNEPATVRYSLKGPSRRTVKRGRLDAGHARLHAAAAEARHLPRRAHGRGRLRQEDHPAQLLRHTLML